MPGEEGLTSRSKWIVGAARGSGHDGQQQASPHARGSEANVFLVELEAARFVVAHAERPKLSPNRPVGRTSRTRTRIENPMTGS